MEYHIILKPYVSRVFYRNHILYGIDMGTLIMNYHEIIVINSQVI